MSVFGKTTELPPASLDHSALVRLPLGVYLSVLFGLLFFSCGGPPSTPGEAGSVADNLPPPKYKLIFVIHGDGGYLFHDTAGNDYRADLEALAGAQKVAERNPEAEVFIFHEKRRRHTLFIFPRRDGEFFYFRNGRLLARESYWRDQGESRFAPEIALYDRFRAEESLSQTRFFLYFGHEIPEINGRDYDASYRDRPFIVDDLARELRHFLPDSTRFDLIMLSTCFNGTPHTISALSSYARYIIASPGNLHLSYLDLLPFENLDSGLQGNDISTFANECARVSFERLTKVVQTEVTIAVYDIDRVQPYVHAVNSHYDRTLDSTATLATTSFVHCDCAEDTMYVLPTMNDGLEMLFRPARFGRSAHKQSHSGWECLRILK